MKPGIDNQRVTGNFTVIIRAIAFAVFFSTLTGSTYGLEPNEILIIANSEIADSIDIAIHYHRKRGVPYENILVLPLGKVIKDTISRADYQSNLVKPVRKKLASLKFPGKIRCLLTIYGVPYKVRGRGALKNQQQKLKKLKLNLEQKKNSLKQLELKSSKVSIEKRKKVSSEIYYLQSEINYIVGKETNASVDSELSMVLFDDYELYRWQPNNLHNMLYWDFKTLMVCRLDGPGAQIAKNLVNKAIKTENAGLKGVAYIDSGYSKKKNKTASLYAEFDQSLQMTAWMIQTCTSMKVIEERMSSVFKTGSCPKAALYCGWYSLKKYIDAFDFVNGAVGYHIASFEADDLRDPNSTQWCPAMLADGITATLGPVTEPYLGAFPKPDEFFRELLNGRCLVEAYYRTKPFNSWQMVLIGDPLYKPFLRLSHKTPTK